MKVGIDVSNLHSLNKGRGIGYYTENLVSALKKYTEVEVVVIESKKSKTKVDLVHYPYFDLFAPTLKVERDAPVVVTIHDVIPLVYSDAYPAGLRGTVKNFHQRMALKKVRAVITDSECSKKDITRYLKVNSSKINVVYLAASEKFERINDQKELERVRKRYQLPEKFVLFTGSTNYNKNLVNLTEAAVSAGVDIVFVGKSFENKENMDHVELRPFAEFSQRFGQNQLVHILGFVEDSDIVDIYNLAEILLLPSFYEGFGLTILEAQQCGVPVITGNISSMPEVAGDGAALVDPNSVEEIKNQILKMRNNKKYRQELIEKGFENAKRFSWEKTAKETVKVYEKTLGR